MAPSVALLPEEVRSENAQAVRLINRVIADRRLDLSGLRVLTEAGVGLGRLTAVLAAVAGAEVFAVSRDTVEGTRRDAESQTAELASLAHVQDRVHLVATRLHAPRGAVDIITNLPGVQPIDESVLRAAAETGVVSLMGGVAQVRSDVDLAACRRLKIAVAGLSEEALGLCRSASSAALYGLLSLGVDVTAADVVIAGEGPLFASTAKGLARAGVNVLAACGENAGRLGLYDARKIGDGLGDESVTEQLSRADAVVVCAGQPDVRTIGAGAWLAPADLAARAPHMVVVHLCGEIDRRALAAAGVRVWPSSGPGAAHDLLPGPRLEQHAAGLVVGAVLARARLKGSSPLAAEQLAAAEAGAQLVPQDLGALRR